MEEISEEEIMEVALRKEVVEETLEEKIREEVT